MEVATEPQPARAPMAAPTEQQADPWHEFLQRVLPSTPPASGGGDAGAQPSDDALLTSAPLSVE